ncbi:response regulator [Fulvivirgaceae bacterium BMA12]|uniref:Response regulator n=1 Tax=Agaribacillus aureus TaxID=3051825 RepID=A0ABT8L4G6_9BACT|nr:response regulator [Fulvivirgaceae bacterium BMA12]
MDTYIGDNTVKRAMIIDDCEIDRFLAQKIIILCDFAGHILTMNSAPEALKYLNNNLDEDKLPEIIFLDISMPNMDGFAFLTHYAQCHQRVKNHCKIVALTSSTHPRDLQALQSDPYVIRYLAKPLTPENLMTIYQQIN